jgi:hypothetical protein
MKIIFNPLYPDKKDCLVKYSSKIYCMNRRYINNNIFGIILFKTNYKKKYK